MYPREGKIGISIYCMHALMPFSSSTIKSCCCTAGAGAGGGVFFLIVSNQKRSYRQLQVHSMGGWGGAIGPPLKRKTSNALPPPHGLANKTTKTLKSPVLGKCWRFHHTSTAAGGVKRKRPGSGYPCKTFNPSRQHDLTAALVPPSISRRFALRHRVACQEHAAGLAGFHHLPSLLRCRTRTPTNHFLHETSETETSASNRNGERTATTHQPRSQPKACQRTLRAAAAAVSAPSPALTFAAPTTPFSLSTSTAAP